MNIIERIVELVRNEDFIYIQTHNFPDHDAVASAAGLGHLLGVYGIRSHLIYEGTIDRDSLLRMIGDLGISIQNNTEHHMTEAHKIVIVDGCKGNKNVTDLIGDEIAVIDHHEVTATEDVPLVDIRPECGACSSIIYSYYQDFGVEVPRRIATALMIGINMDTALLTRGVSEYDIRAYADLYELADIPLQNSILRNYIQTKDLDFYRLALNSVIIKDTVAFCYFPQGCNQNLLGILGDFFLALAEVDFVILCANNDNRINFSLRSERKEWNASIIIQDVLKGIGFGGGHADMAGGIIRETSNFNEKRLQGMFMERLMKR